MAKILKSGTPAPASAQYRVIGPRGGDTGKEVTGIKGKPMPPTKAGGGFAIADRTHNKSGRGH